ncbi:MAG: S-methyl-5'-thioadenosine phosphorylase [Tepidisphaeraceae bacterium]|jgi:5'-methylthioadenosine phosphorylase
MSTVKVGVIGGSGLGQVLGDATSGVRHEIQTPFGPPSDAVTETEWHGLPVFVVSRHGPGHLRNPSEIPFRANIFALKQLGVTHIIASGAVGSLREHLRPRDLVLCDQVIDKTSRRAGTFYERAAVHVEMAEPFCPVLRGILAEAGREVAAAGGFQVHDRGCYVCMEGPAFSTRAESHMHRLWGGDLIGMSAMPEARLAREAEIAYALVALVTDYDCWKPHAGGQGPADKHALLSEIISHLQTATNNAISMIRRAVELLAERQDSLPPSPAHSALELAIWSDKSRIPPEHVQQLAPLWIKYFG